MEGDVLVLGVLLPLVLEENDWVTVKDRVPEEEGEGRGEELGQWDGDELAVTLLLCVGLDEGD